VRISGGFDCGHRLGVGALKEVRIYPQRYRWRAMPDTPAVLEHIDVGRNEHAQMGMAEGRKGQVWQSQTSAAPLSSKTSSGISHPIALSRW
jgi:hypothetical protein